MPPSTGSEPISDDELLYRRIPVSMGWYRNGIVFSDAFYPRDDEITGLSVYRANYKSLAAVAQGRSKRGYYVAVLRAGDLRAAGIDVGPAPEPDDPGHAEIPNLTSANRDTTYAQERMVLLAMRLCRSVEGPFPPADS